MQTPTKTQLSPSQQQNEDQAQVSAKATLMDPTLIKVNNKGGSRRYITYGIKLFTKEKAQSVTITGLGQAVSIAFTVAEVLFKRVGNLHWTSKCETVSLLSKLGGERDLTKVTIDLTINEPEDVKGRQDYRRPVPPTERFKKESKRSEEQLPLEETKEEGDKGRSKSRQKRRPTTAAAAGGKENAPRNGNRGGESRPSRDAAEKFHSKPAIMGRKKSQHKEVMEPWGERRPIQ